MKQRPFTHYTRIFSMRKGRNYLLAAFYREQFGRVDILRCVVDFLRFYIRSGLELRRFFYLSSNFQR